ncbi:MAG TPA: TM2 domain-containing protein [Mycobacterium sp.]|nr:TM2 domain-containing protein [Mycobacterium sp.]
MTDQSWNDAAGSGSPSQQPPGYPPPQQPPGYQSGYPPPYPPYPPYQAPGPYYDPSAPFGRHPVTGQPLSDKSKTVAGLLQLLSLIGIGGIGRFYIGDIGIGIAQLLVGWLTCGIGLIWSIVDAVLILTDKVPDSQGRPLRDGT